MDFSAKGKAQLLSLPLLVNAIPFVIDRLFLGHFSTEALASMQISAIFFSLFSVICALSTGSLRQRFFIGSALAVISLMGINALTALFPMASPGVQEAAKDYLICVIPALPIYLLVNAKSSLHIAFQGACLHVALAAILIFGLFGLPAMGVQGAAIALVTAALFQLFSSSGRKKQRKAGSLRSFIERTIQYGGYVVLTVMVGLLGDKAMAAQQALIVLGVLSFLFAEGLLRRGLQLSALLVSCASLVFWLMPSLLMQLFTSDPEVIALGASSLQLFALIQPLTLVALALSDSAKSKVAGLVSLFGGVGVRLFAAYYLAFVQGFGLVGIWWGVAADWLVRSLLFIAIHHLSAFLKRTAVLKS